MNENLVKNKILVGIFIFYNNPEKGKILDFIIIQKYIRYKQIFIIKTQNLPTQ